jgi:holo-[acyl-carrier protein] synthase
MEIIGIGADIVECVRIGRMIEEHGEQFLARVFIAEEIRFCRQRKNATEHFASHWAAKEAVLKALGIQSVQGLSWTELEIDCATEKRPKVQLTGAIKEYAQQERVDELLVSMAHCRAYATAYVLAVKT